MRPWRIGIRDFLTNLSVSSVPLRREKADMIVSLIFSGSLLEIPAPWFALARKFDVVEFDGLVACG